MPGLEWTECIPGKVRSCDTVKHHCWAKKRRTSYRMSGVNGLIVCCRSTRPSASQHNMNSGLYLSSPGWQGMIGGWIAGKLSAIPTIMTRVRESHFAIQHGAPEPHGRVHRWTQHLQQTNNIEPRSSETQDWENPPNHCPINLKTTHPL